MDFQKLADSIFSPACIVSVEKKEDDGYGDIRLVAGNKKYLAIVEKRIKSGDTISRRPFETGSRYLDYFPQNRSFEEVCYRAAILRKESHTYGHVPSVDVWFDVYAIPLDYSEGNTYYCIYVNVPNNTADALFDTITPSKTANDVLKTCIKLHRARNLKEAMESVISEIRLICRAEGCTVLLLNNEEKDYSILATNYVKSSKIKRVTEFASFYEIANSWKDMLGGEGDCIILRNQEEIEQVAKINHPWYVTLVDAGVKSVVLFPLRQGNDILGFIWAINFDVESTMRIKETLELTTFFVSSHIARYKLIKRLEKMSYSDVLTGLPNRFAYSEYITDLIQKGERFATVSIDLNNFKKINDTLGFDAGNHVLTEVANRWKDVSENDSSRYVKRLFRLAGDEFFLVISGYNTEEELQTLIEDYVKVLKENVTVDDYDLHVSASFGYTEFPLDADTADALMSRANAAMYEIKKAASSEHVLHFTPDIAKNERLLEIENLIRTALLNDTIYFLLQPQYDVNHCLRGFEALARIKDAEGNVVPPGDFIPVAEKVGLIDRVDKAVFRKACSFFGKLLNKTDAKLTLSLNVSVRHLMKSDFLEEIRDLLLSSGIPANQLEIEITESIMIDSVDKALHCIDELKNMGLKIAIDDFGTGYSSLSYLNKFPANLLKIDKSFIDKMNVSDSSRQYVAAIISMGHVMGFDVISEGVEKPDQLEVLKAIGCDYIQGFIWGRPLPVPEAEKLVTKLH